MSWIIDRLWYDGDIAYARRATSMDFVFGWSVSQNFCSMNWLACLFCWVEEYLFVLLLLFVLFVVVCWGLNWPWLLRMWPPRGPKEFVLLYMSLKMAFETAKILIVANKRASRFIEWQPSTWPQCLFCLKGAFSMASMFVVVFVCFLGGLKLGLLVCLKAGFKMASKVLLNVAFKTAWYLFKSGLQNGLKSYSEYGFQDGLILVQKWPSK